MGFRVRALGFEGLAFKGLGVWDFRLVGFRVRTIRNSITKAALSIKSLLKSQNGAFCAEGGMLVAFVLRWGRMT